ncbi:hypothetical protein X777_09144, partial [Ooceraea biroi]
RQFGVNVAYKCMNALSKFIIVKKDPMDRMTHCNVVYKISSCDCEASYVGQTKRRLRTRISEHRKDINKKSGSPSVISKHRLELGYDFDWNDVRILDEEGSLKRRLVSEMINYKKRQLHLLNLQNDTELLSEDYLPILNKLTLT